MSTDGNIKINTNHPSDHLYKRRHVDTEDTNAPRIAFVASVSDALISIALVVLASQKQAMNAAQNFHEIIPNIEI